MYFDTRNTSEKSFVHSIANELIDCGFRKDTAIVCIGTDRAIYDAFGPLVGQFLEEVHTGINVYGTVKKPIHYMNMFDIIPRVQERESHILCIDAAADCEGKIGNVQILPSACYPGTGDKKKSFDNGVGNLQLTYCIIPKNSTDMVKRNIRLNDIYFVAKSVADAIKIAKWEIEHGSIDDNIISFNSVSRLKKVSY